MTAAAASGSEVHPTSVPAAAAAESAAASSAALQPVESAQRIPEASHAELCEQSHWEDPDADLAPEDLDQQAESGVGSRDAEQKDIMALAAELDDENDDDLLDDLELDFEC